MAEIVIVGGGVGGVVAAKRLRRALGGGNGVTVIDRARDLMIQPSILWVAADRRTSVVFIVYTLCSRCTLCGLAPYHRPGWRCRTDGLPQTPAGRQDRCACRDVAAQVSRRAIRSGHAHRGAPPRPRCARPLGGPRLHP